MAEPLRILFAIPELDAGGPDRVFYEIIRGLNRNVFAPQLVVSRSGGRYLDALPEDVEISVIGGGRYPLRRFARTVDRLRPDLVLSTLRMNITAAAAQPFQKHRPPLVARQANAISQSFFELKKRSLIKHRLAEVVVKRLLKVPTALVAQSCDMAQELERHTIGSQKVAVIGNPVSLTDIDAACKAQQKISSVEPKGAPTLIAVGRLAYQKGFEILLPAFARFLQQHPKAVLKIFGEGPDRDALQCQAEDLGIDHAMEMPGQSDTILAEITAADIFVSSSRYEGFSNAILEAMALGRLVVATNSEGATKDLVQDGVTGLIVAEVTSDALFEGLSRAMTIDGASVGARARQYVYSQYSRESVVQSYEQLFLDLIGIGQFKSGDPALSRVVAETSQGK